jgi:hypothetical protein
MDPLWQRQQEDAYPMPLEGVDCIAFEFLSLTTLYVG